MADANSASDTQVLLQSMLQRLRLQTRPEINSTHAQDEVQYSTTAIEQNGSVAESPPQTPPMYNFNFFTDKRRFCMARPPSPDPTGVSTSPPSQEFAQGIVHNSGMSSTPIQRNLSLQFTGNQTVSHGSVSSLQSVEKSLPLTHISSQTESNIQGQGVGQKRWTQKLKDKWRDRHRNLSRKERDDGEKQDLSKVAHSIRSPIPVQTIPNENNTTTALDEELGVQHQPIDNGIPGSLDHMGETLISPGSFNLMEEIFTGQEWAKFFSSSTSNQPASTSITQDQGTGLTSSISQSYQNERTMFSQWNSRQATGPYLGTTQSESSYSMDTTGNMFNQSKTSSFSVSPMSKFHNGQYGLGQFDSGSNHVEGMDLSISTMEDNHPINEQAYGYPYSGMNQLQATGMNHHQPGRLHEVNPLLDLSYLQSKDGSSLKKQVPLSRKRGHSTESRDSNEQWRSEPGDMQTWRHNSFHSDSAPSLSSASSTSSLQHSFPQDSEMLTETVIKKRRVENKRHVRFAEEVTIVPAPVLSDDDGDDGDDGDDDYGHNADEGNDVSGEESPPRTTVPRWIEALRSKTTKKSKLKLPRMRTKKYNFL